MSGTPRNVQEMEPEATAPADSAARPAGMPLEDWLKEKARREANANRAAAPAARPDDAGTASARLNKIATQIDPRDEADHGGLSGSRTEDPLHTMERTVRAIVGHLETSDRRNADALRHMQTQLHHIAKNSGGAALGEIEKRLDSLAGRIEAINPDTARPDATSLEQRIASVAATIARGAEPGSGTQTAPAEPSADGDGYMSDFMRRQKRRRELMSGSGGTPAPAPAEAQPLPDISGMIDEKTAALEDRLLQRFTELSQSLRSSMAKPPQPAKEIGDLQSLVKDLNDRVNKLAKKPAAPVYDDSEMRMAVNALHERMAAAEDRFQGLDSIERTMGKLMSRLDTAEELIRQQATAPAGGQAHEERFEKLFEQLDDSREAMMAAARTAASEIAESTAGDTARKTAESAVREAQNAAVEAAREAARSYMDEINSGRNTSAEDTRILASMQANLEQLRTEIDSADYRTRTAFESVQETLESLTGRIAEAENRPVAAAIMPKQAPRQETVAAPPEDKHADPLMDNGPSARREPTFGNDITQAPSGGAPDLPPSLAEVRLPALEVPSLDAKSEFVRDEVARRAAEAGDEDEPAEIDRPREPGAGPPRRDAASFESAPDGNETDRDGASARDATPAPDALAIGKAAAGDMGHVHQALDDDDLFDDAGARREPDMDASPSSLRSARTTNELLAAARRAADAASGQKKPRADRKSLRDRLRIPRGAVARTGKDTATAKPVTPAKAASTAAPGGGKVPSGKSSVRKPVMLAVAAVILLAGSVEIYKIVKDNGVDFLGGNKPAKLNTTDESAKDTSAPADAGKQGENASPAESETSDVTGSITAQETAPADAAGTAPLAKTMTATGATAAPPRDETAAIGAQDIMPQAAGTDLALPEGIEPASLRAAAIAGDPVAQFEVASRLMEGRGAEKDLGAARNWFQRAAANGLAPAQYRLGSIYEKGTGVPKDTQQARVWYQRAAEQGNRKAMHNLAVLYADGLDGKPDFQTAARWFRAAADLGLSDSQYNLGILHVRGLGVPQNFAEAHKWFSIVATKGDQDAANRRDAIADRLSPDDLAAARLAAQTWQAKPLVTEANAVRLPDDGWRLAESEAAPEPEIATAGEQATGTATSTPNISGGDEIIRRAQELLTSLGYEPGPADGMMGPKTRDAITIFQLRVGMAPTGQITPDLIKKLLQQSG